ncbi:MAG: hypothetical protein OSB21_04990 [Myxococcota bacterium]|nr:hypothetical protein [Myxococcota bacterium]
MGVVTYLGKNISMGWLCGVTLLSELDWYWECFGLGTGLAGELSF